MPRHNTSPIPVRLRSRQRWCCGPLRSAWCRAAQVDRHQLRDARLLHRHAVEPVGELHRALVVRDDDELRPIRHLAHDLVEAVDVRLVERRVDLVEHAERRRLDLEDGEQQRHRGERLLAARQQLDAADLLARRLRHDLDRRSRACRLSSARALRRLRRRGRERQRRVTAAEEAREDRLELGVDRVERLAEPLARGPVDLLDRRLQLTDRTLEIAPLRGQEVEALLSSSDSSMAVRLISPMRSMRPRSSSARVSSTSAEQRPQVIVVEHRRDLDADSARRCHPRRSAASSRSGRAGARADRAPRRARSACDRSSRAASSTSVSADSRTSYAARPASRSTDARFTLLARHRELGREHVARRSQLRRPTRRIFDLERESLAASDELAVGRRKPQRRGLGRGTLRRRAAPRARAPRSTRRVSCSTAIAMRRDPSDQIELRTLLGSRSARRVTAPLARGDVVASRSRAAACSSSSCSRRAGRAGRDALELRADRATRPSPGP